MDRKEDDERQEFLASIDALNAEAGGGEPVVSTKRLGRLKLRSGTLYFADPMFMLGQEVPNIAADAVEIWATLWQYPSGAATVAALRLNLSETSATGAPRKLGEFGIDSAKVAIADKADVDEHWTETGNDRIGVTNDIVLRLLTERFQLETIRVGEFESEVVGPVSEELAAEIEAFFNTDPVYSVWPALYFRVQTNSSYERAEAMRGAWEFMPVGNNPEPLMFDCQTGRGDGGYEILGEFAGETLCALTVTFIEE